MSEREDAVTDEERAALALGVHDALRCNCDSGLRDEMVAGDLAPVVERIISSRVAEALAPVLALADRWADEAGNDRDIESRTLRVVAAALRAAAGTQAGPPVRCREHLRQQEEAVLPHLPRSASRKHGQNSATGYTPGYSD